MADMTDNLIRALMSAQFNGSNNGQVNQGPFQSYGDASAPVYGGSMQIPDTGLSLQGQYQQYPGMRQPNIGIGLRYGLDF